MAEKYTRTEIFESVPEGKAILSLAVPTIISQLISVIYNLADTFYIGQTGDSLKIAGVSLAFTVFMMTVAIANLFGIGGGSLIARLLGRKETEEARKVCAFSLYGAAAAAILYSVIIGLTLTPLLKLLGASQDTLGFARQYVLPVVVFGGPPMILSGVLAHLLRNVGCAKQASYGLSGGGILNIILDPVFMFLIFPKGQEVLAAGIATMISNICSAVYLFLMLQKTSKKAPVSADFRLLKTLRRDSIKGVFATGVPSAILTGLFDLANVFLNKLSANHGDLQLAAVGIVMKAERLPNAINLGICQGMMPIVAYNYASGNHDRMDRTIKTARRMGILVACASMVLLFILARPIVTFFLNTNGENADAALTTIAFGVSYLHIRCFASPFQFLNYQSSYCLQGMGNGRGTLIHAFAREIVFYIPCMYIFDALLGENGLAAALPIGECFGALFALWLLNFWLKKQKKKEAAGA